MGDVIRDLHIDAHELFSGAAQSVHGSCFDQVLNGPLIHLFFVGLKKSPINYPNLHSC